MFVPLWALISLCVLAALPVLALGLLFHLAMHDRGLCFLGRRDIYLPNHVLQERWCFLYVPVHRRIGCHSLASL
ncbi:hypothetical protein [Sphingomonas sp. 3-13AW]|uniref:hypothetical protein n=1 Tax=Sphingomonas sp. 3-13AW TaxID=3050450 RepID=UPI003BB6F611